MKSTLDEIFHQAESLSATDRAALASRLLEGLEGPPDAGAEQAWVEEADRRLEAYERGEVKAIPAAEVKRKIRERRR
jgi:putative addiction module component (TIGR02574 family)